MQEQDAEHTLIRRSQNGDKSAFGELIELYQGFVYNTAFYMVKNSDDAFDLTQDTFFKAYKSISAFRFECKFSTWLYRICQNCARDFFRKQKKRQNDISLCDYDKEGDLVERDIADPSPAQDPEDSLLQKERARIVRDAILSLPREYREIIVLRDIEGYSYEDIAAALGTRLGTVKSRLFRAREKLKESLSGAEPFL